MPRRLQDGRSWQKSLLTAQCFHVAPVRAWIMPLFFFIYFKLFILIYFILKTSCCSIWPRHNSPFFSPYCFVLLFLFLLTFESDGGSMAVREIRLATPSPLDWKAPPLRRSLPGNERLANLSFRPMMPFSSASSAIHHALARPSVRRPALLC